MTRAACRMDGCEKESAGRGLCSTHWARWRKHGDPTVVLPSNTVSKQPCSVADCGRLAHAHSFCTMHLARWKKHGDPLVIGENRGRPLKGAVPTFGAVHRRLYRTRGRARNFECVDCGGPARDWSYDGLDADELREAIRGSDVAYSLDLDHYAPRCVSCHRKFDRAGQRPRDVAGRFLAA